MAGSANDLLRSRNAEKLQPGTTNRHRTQPWTNRVHNLVGENGHAKSLICHTEWSDQRQENDVIELIRAPFHVADLSSETLHVIGRMSAFRSSRSFKLSVTFHTPRQHTHMGHIHRLCVTAHRSQSKRSTHTTRHNPTPPSRAIHVVSDFSFSHKRRKECNKSAHDRVLILLTRKVCKRLEKHRWCLALVAAHTRTPHNDPTRTNFPETNSKKKCPRCTLAKN